MLILGILFVLLIASVLIGYCFRNNWGDWHISGIVLFMFVTPLFVISLITIPLNRMGVYSRILEIEAIRTTDKGSELNSATWRTQAAIINAEIASMKYYNHTVWGIWIPDEIDTLKPIE